MRAYVGIILLLFLLKENEGSRSKRDMKIACEKYTEVSGKLTPLPWGLGANFTPPWTRTDAKLYVSKHFSDNWSWMKALPVRGLNATLEDFMMILESNRCLFIPYGEAVKDLLLGIDKMNTILKLEGESTCSVDKVYELCSKAYGPQSCGAKPTKPYHRVTVGRMNDMKRYTTLMVDPIVIGEWNSTFDRTKAHWEFTANAVGLLDNMAGGVHIIDLSGNGVRDVCLRRISLPVGIEDFDKWSGKNLVKVMRYFNLEAKTYLPADEVDKRVIEEVQRIYSTSKFLEYYCKYVLDGVFVPYPHDPYSITDLNAAEIKPPECRVVRPDSPRERMIGDINETLEARFGGFWQTRMLPDLKSLKLVKLDDSFVLARAPEQASWPRYETTTESAKEVPVTAGNDRIIKDDDDAIRGDDEGVIRDTGDAVRDENGEEIIYVDCENAAWTLSIPIVTIIFCAIIFNI